MMIRQRPFRLGQRVKLHDSAVIGGSNAYPLPPGWHREEVTVIGYDHGYVRVLGDGKELSIDNRRKRVPVSDPIQKAVRKSRKKTEDFPERRRTVRFDSIKPYQQPKLSDPARGTLAIATVMRWPG